jgi:hypothetical protein
MARLFDDIHDPLMRDLCGTAVSEPDALYTVEEPFVDVETSFIDATEDRLRARRERMLARKINLAHERGDLAAIAILEGPIFGYADRFIAEG